MAGGPAHPPGTARLAVRGQGPPAPLEAQERQAGRPAAAILGMDRPGADRLAGCIRLCQEQGQGRAVKMPTGLQGALAVFQIAGLESLLERATKICRPEGTEIRLREAQGAGGTHRQEARASLPEGPAVRPEGDLEHPRISPPRRQAAGAQGQPGPEVLVPVRRRREAATS